MGEAKRREQARLKQGTEHRTPQKEPNLILPNVPEKSNLIIKLGKFVLTQSMRSISPRQIKAAGIVDAGVCVPITINGFSVENVNVPGKKIDVPWTGGLAFPSLGRNGIICVGAMYHCGDKSIPEETAKVFVKYATDLAEPEIKYLVATAYRDYLTERLRVLQLVGNME
ncbi:hypothetical protein QUA54_31500 [Microcoleus sp. MOSTC5]|uniref:hypothetical protein n=1 Tax=Microcoleus sp. MOSTC5 TaxID=3055378 RepID=UPI002FD6D8A1